MQTEVTKFSGYLVPRVGLILLVLSVILSCSSDSKEPNTKAPENCSLVSQNQYVFDLMKDFYLWYKEVPDVDPAQFPSPEVLLSALTFSPLDRFSSISDQQVQALFLGQGQFIGIGIRMKTDDTGRLFVSLVFQVRLLRVPAWFAVLRSSRSMAIWSVRF